MGSATLRLVAVESAPSAVAAETRTASVASAARSTGQPAWSTPGRERLSRRPESQRHARDQQRCGHDLPTGGGLEAVERAASIACQQQAGESRQAGVASQQDPVVTLSTAAEATTGDSLLPTATGQQQRRECRQRCQRRHSGNSRRRQRQPCDRQLPRPVRTRRPRAEPAAAGRSARASAASVRGRRASRARPRRRQALRWRRRSERAARASDPGDPTNPAGSLCHRAEPVSEGRIETTSWKVGGPPHMLLSGCSSLCSARRSWRWRGRSGPCTCGSARAARSSSTTKGLRWETWWSRCRPATRSAAR